MVEILIRDKTWINNGENFTMDEEYYKMKKIFLDCLALKFSFIYIHFNTTLIYKHYRIDP